MATITAKLSTRVDARGKSEILLRFVAGREHIYRLHSRLFISPSRWKDGAIVIPRLGTEEQKGLRDLKVRLDGLTAFLLDAFSEADREAVDRDWMQQQVERYHHPERREKLDFFALFDEFRKEKDISKARDNRYAVTVRALERFQVYRKKKVTVEGMDQEALEQFRKFLEEEYILADKKRWRTLYQAMEEKPEKRSHNTIVDYMKALSAFYHWMNKKGLTTADPFRTFEIGTAVYGTPYYITIEERDQLYRTDLSDSPALAVQRDIFVFQCLVGCRVGDLIALTKGDVVDGVLVYVQQKTIKENARTIRVPLTETAREIVVRYADTEDDRLLPFISKQKYNEAIKRMFLAAGLTRHVSVLDPVTQKEVKRPLNEVASSHLARRTFVGNLYKQVKDPNIVSSMSGHEDGSRAFARYRDIDDEIKAGVVSLLEGKK